MEEMIGADIASRSFETALINAAGGGHFAVVYYLIRKGVCVNHANEKGSTALIEAVTHGHRSVVELLVANKADVSQTDNEGVTALMNASRKGNLDLVGYLLLLKVAVDQADSKGETALMKASANGHLPVAQYLAGQGAHIHKTNNQGRGAFDMAVENGHEPMVEWLLEQQDKKREEALSSAAKQGHSTIVVKLLNTLVHSKRDVELMWPLFSEASKAGHIDTLVALEKYYLPYMKNAKFSLGCPAVEAAARSGKFRVVEWLVGLSERHKGNLGSWQLKAIMAAADGGHLDGFKVLVSFVKASLEQKNAALIKAATTGHLSIVKFLIDQGCIVTGTSGTPPKALITAALNGHLSIVEYLANLDLGNLNVMDESKRTAIMYAAWDGHLAVVEHLASVGADVTLSTTTGCSALTLAAGGGHLPVVKWLVNHSGDINTRQAIIEATDNGHLPVVEYLAANGVDLAADGSMLLMKAASKGHMAVVKFLVGCGVDVNCIDDNGNTALTLAVSGGWIAIARYLVAHGAEINKFGAAAITDAGKYGRLHILEYLYDTLGTTDIFPNTVKLPAASLSSVPMKLPV